MLFCYCYLCKKGSALLILVIQFETVSSVIVKMQIISSIDFQQKMEEPEYDDELWRWKKET